MGKIVAARLKLLTIFHIMPSDGQASQAVSGQTAGGAMAVSDGLKGLLAIKKSRLRLQYRIIAKTQTN
ncbi:MAG: hypothetical protein Q4G28_05770 [Neisseria sp.]|nr:hypothetical protein [Neisseria sp.]